MKRLIFVLIPVFFLNDLFSQEDSVHSKELKEVIIKAWQHNDISRLPEVQNNIITTGKKNELISLAGINADISLKTGRQLFSKVPGVFVYDMDGSGNQLNISTRGLDPHRSWEFNLRQNGVLINSDMYGYPASHYSAPMESFEKIEIIRGTGSLQYGAQFGGMVNYVTKKPDTANVFSLQSVNTAGSFGLLSSYNAISGTVKKFSYYAYYYKRHSKGYRKNSESEADAQFIQMQYRFTENLSIKAEAGRSKYLYQIPGPLNDSMFRADARTSTRSRNFFSPDIYVPSLSVNWKLSKQNQINFIASGVFGDRSSVMLDAFSTIPDIDPATGRNKNRQVDIDRFNSRTVEARLLREYRIGKIKNKLAAGIVYMNNNLHRRQLGKGTTGSDYDLTVENGIFKRDLHFKTSNLAVYAENVFQFTDRLSVSLGARTENGSSKMKGSINYYNNENVPNTIDHHFLLLGGSTQYSLNKENTFYSGISQSYRPVIFKDIIPASPYEKVDKNLKNAYGYNAEIGIRGKILKRLQYDISLFQLQYKNRMGSLVLTDANGSYIYRTNIGNSRTKGIEFFTQYKFPFGAGFFAGLFTSTAYMEARYTSGIVAAGGINKSIKGNKVEAVPNWNTRNGLEIIYKGFSSTILYNYTSFTYSDALNTVTPPADGSKGYTPAYSVWDFNILYRINEQISLRSGVNNFFNKQYFTKRPTFYPGPGIWPSDGRNGYITIAVKID